MPVIAARVVLTHTHTHELARGRHGSWLLHWFRTGAPVPLGKGWRHPPDPSTRGIEEDQGPVNGFTWHSY